MSRTPTLYEARLIVEAADRKDRHAALRLRNELIENLRERGTSAEVLAILFNLTIARVHQIARARK